MNGVDYLQEQLEIHRKSLRDVQDSLKKLTGGEKFNDRDSESKEKSNDKNLKAINLKESIADSTNDRRANRNNNEKNFLKRKLNDDRRNNRRGPNNKYDDNESAEEDGQIKKRTLQSSVISSNMPIKSKEDLIKIQNKFNGSEQRNKRIFGVILGTLRQFKTEDSERSSTTQAIHRKEIETKIEVKKVEEMKMINEERKKLQEQKLNAIKEIEILEQKIELTQEFDNWKKNQLIYKNFIRTKTKPFLFYLPKAHDPVSTALLQETSDLIEETILKKSKEVEIELESLNKERLILIKNNSDDLNSEISNKENKKHNKTDLDSKSEDSELDENKDNIDVQIGDVEQDDDDNLNNNNNNLKKENDVDKKEETDENKSKEADREGEKMNTEEENNEMNAETDNNNITAETKEENSDLKENKND